MKNAVKNLQEGLATAAASRPKVNGFPVLAETLRRFGVRRNEWYLPACLSLYWTDLGAVAQQEKPLQSGLGPVPAFDMNALLAAIESDKAGRSAFPEFLAASWKAGVVRFRVDFDARSVTYFGATQESYVEHYPAV